METETTKAVDTSTNSNTVEDTSPAASGELVTTANETSLEPRKKVNWWFRIKLALFLITLILITIGIVVLVNAYGVYKNAEKYKKAHDAAISEFNRCDDVQNTQQQRDVFVYCDTLKEKFKEVER